MSTDEKDQLFELMRQRRVEARRAEIVANAGELRQAIEAGTAKTGSVDDLIADLLGDDDESCLE